MLRTLVIGIAGLLLAGFVLVAYVSMQSPPKAGPKPVAVKTVALIATAHPVRAGSLLQPNDLAVRNVPEDKIPPGAQRDATEARNALIGAMVRRMLGDHDIIAGNDVLRPGDRGFLAAVLAPGARAISVAVDAVSGEAGLIWPGDRVDLILTQTLENAEQSMAHRVSGETVLADVRVIAVDQQLVQGGQATGLIDGHGPTSRTITLEVSARDAERVAVATRLGKLLVVLRSAQSSAVAQAQPQPQPDDPPPGPIPAKAPQPEETRPVWGGDVSRALSGGHAAPDTEVRLYLGGQQVEVYKY
jgi:pilus assembly protein CpaB